MDGRRIACDRCGAEVGAEERHAEIEYVYGDGGGNMTLCRDCFKLVMDTVHGQEAKRQGDAEPPTMDERRAVARRLREHNCPVLSSQQTTREAVDAVVECMGLEDDEEMCTVRYFLDRLADLIDPGADTTMSAYDLLPEDGRDALDWVREHGGVEHVKEQGEALARRLSALAREAVADADPEAEAEALDVLERAVNCRLMPEGMEWLVEAWPRFEDGEPVRFLDDFERDGDENGIGAVTMYPDGSFALNFRAYSKGERVRRPAPKVLDADGVEIRVGDRLYDTDTGCGRTVRAVNDNGTVEFDGHGNRGWFGKFLTHRAPVLAADGRPLRVGEEVWKIKNGDGLYHVQEIRDGVSVCVEETSCEFMPKELTHEQPDSWERLEDDATQHPWYYCKQHGVDTDAASPDADLAEVVTPFARDLVRRAKALCERGER